MSNISPLPESSENIFSSFKHPFNHFRTWAIPVDWFLIQTPDHNTFISVSFHWEGLDPKPRRTSGWPLACPVLPTQENPQMALRLHFLDVTVELKPLWLLLAPSHLAHCGCEQRAGLRVYFWTIMASDPCVCRKGGWVGLHTNLPFWHSRLGKRQQPAGGAPAAVHR